MKIFHAYGYVGRDNFIIEGDEKWERDSYFSDVFAGFEQAKEFLLESFKCRVKWIYADDLLFSRKKDNDSGGDFFSESKIWQKEYISEYICYNLTIDEFDPNDYSDWNKRKTSKNSRGFCLDDPYKIMWELDYSGEIITRHLYYDGISYEFRESDYLPTAGTKFQKGDMLKIKNESIFNENDTIYVVSDTPINRNNENKPWENYYHLWSIDGLSSSDSARRQSCYGQYSLNDSNDIHENELELFDDTRIEDDSPLRLLQRLAKGEIELSEAMWKKLFNGEIVLNNKPSWRDIEELNPKRKAK